MKYAAHIYLWTKIWADREVGLFARAKALGMDLLEISIGDDILFDVALTNRAAKDAGMEIVIGPGGLWPEGADLSDDDPANRKLRWIGIVSRLISRWRWARKRIPERFTDDPAKCCADVHPRMNIRALQKGYINSPTMLNRPEWGWASSR